MWVGRWTPWRPLLCPVRTGLNEWSRPADWRGVRQGLREDGGDGGSCRHQAVRWLRTRWVALRVQRGLPDELANRGEPYFKSSDALDCHWMKASAGALLAPQ